MKNFIILTTPRTGSTWLGTLLDSHPDIIVHGELFLPYDVPDKYKELRRHDPHKFFRYRMDEKSFRPWATWKYLDYALSYHNDKHSAFKLMAWPLIKHLEILLYIKKHKIPVIYLKRSLKDRVLSYAIAEKTGSFHKLSKEYEEKIPKTEEKVTINPVFTKKIAKKHRFFDFWLKILTKTIKKHVLTVNYNDLEHNTGKELVKIYNFLGLSAVAGDSPIEKTSTRNYDDLIENYDEAMKVIGER